MRRTILLTVVMIAGVAAFAQDKPKAEPAKPVVPPIITETERGEFFKAQAHALSAETALEQTPQFKAAHDEKQVFDENINVLVSKCTQNFALQLIKDGKPDNDGDPTCVAKPEPPKPDETPKPAPTPAKAQEAPKK